MINIWIIVQAYITLFISIIWHEIGHFGSKIRCPYFPLPKMHVENSRFRYGGLLFNAIAFIGIWYFKPEILFLQLIGLMSFLHFLFYTIIGGIGIRDWIWDKIFKERGRSDIESGNYFAIIIGIISIIIFGKYYLTIFNNIFI